MTRIQTVPVAVANLVYRRFGRTGFIVTTFAVSFLLVVAVGIVGRLLLPGTWLLDFAVYHRAATDIMGGADLYGPQNQFTYPPFAAIVFAPLGLLPLPVAGVAFNVMSVVLLAAATLVCLRWSGVVAKWAPWAALGLASVLAVTSPGRATLQLGQVTFLLLLGIVYDLSRPAGHPLKGIGVGLMAGLKLLPGFFILYFLLTRQWRAAAVASGTFLATVALGFACLPSASVIYWGGLVTHTERIGLPQSLFSESLMSVLVRWAHTADGMVAPYVGLAVIVTVIGLFLARRAHRVGEDLLAMTACFCVIVLISPIAWTFYWMWPLVPLVVRLAALALQPSSDRTTLSRVALAGLVLPFLASPERLVTSQIGHELNMNALQLLATSTRAVSGLLILLLIWGLTRSPEASLRTSSRKGADRSFGSVGTVGLSFLAVAVVLTVGYYVFSRARMGGWLYDFNIYYQAGADIAAGQQIYGAHNAFLYPPFGAMLFYPIQVLPAGLAGLLFTAVSLTSLLVAVWLCLRWARWGGTEEPTDRRIVWTAIALGTLFAANEPSRLGIYLGQISFLILFGIIYDLRLPGSHWLKGVGIGLFAGVKLLPGVFILFFACTRQWRAAIVSAGTFAATVLLGFAVLPESSLRYWGDLLSITDSAGAPGEVGPDSTAGLAAQFTPSTFSESILSVLVRWTRSDDGVMLPYIALSLLTLVIGLAVARYAFERGEGLLAAAVCGCVIVLVAPLGWSHYWQWIIVPLAIRLLQLAADGVRLAAVALVLLTIETYVAPANLAHSQTIEAQLNMATWELLVTSTRAAAAVLIIGLVFVLSHRSPTFQERAHQPAGLAPGGG